MVPGPKSCSTHGSKMLQASASPSWAFFAAVADALCPSPVKTGKGLRKSCPGLNESSGRTIQGLTQVLKF